MNGRVENTSFSWLPLAPVGPMRIEIGSTPRHVCCRTTAPPGLAAAEAHGRVKCRDKKEDGHVKAKQIIVFSTLRSYFAKCFMNIALALLLELLMELKQKKKIPLVIYLHPIPKRVHTFLLFFNRATNFKFNQTCTLSVSQ